MKRTISAALAFILAALCLCLASCQIEEEVTTNVTLKIVAGDDVIFDDTVKVYGENPTVLDAVIEAADLYDLDIEYNEDGNSVDKVSYYYSTTIDDVQYYWQFEINGELPDAGKADANKIAEGDEIVYTFVTLSYNSETDKYVAGKYDSSSGIFTENSGEDTTDTDSAAE